MKNKDACVFVAGGRGLVGSAIIRRLKAQGYSNIAAPTSSDVDFTDKAATDSFLKESRPEYVFIAAAKVGGIWANDNAPAEFLYQNLMIQNHLIHGCYEAGVKKLLFLGSSCIYPKESAIPIKESSLLTGPLEPTNEAYALAKIAGVKMCDYYRRQYGCDFISAMPTNVFGPHDNYDLQTAHVVPALIHKFFIAKRERRHSVEIWGSGKPRRELIYSDDLAEACLFLMNHYSEPGPINVGVGEDHSILEIAKLIQRIIGFEGELAFDAAKPDGVFRKVMDVSRLQALGWIARAPLEERLREACEWFSENYGLLF